MIRQPGLFFTRFGRALLFAVLFVLLFEGQENDQDSVPQRVSLTFFMCLALMFAQIAIIPVVVNARPIFYRQRSAQYYSTSTMFWSFIVHQITFAVFETLLLYVIVYHTVNMHPDRHLYFILLTTLINMTGGALCLLAGCYVPSLPIGMSIAGPAIGMSILLCGFIVIESNMKYPVKLLHYISLTTYAFSGLMHSELAGVEFSCEPVELIPPVALPNPSCPTDCPPIPVPDCPACPEPGDEFPVECYILPDMFHTNGERVCPVPNGDLVLEVYDMDDDLGRWGRLVLQLVFVVVLNALAYFVLYRGRHLSAPSRTLASHATTTKQEFGLSYMSSTRVSMSSNAIVMREKNDACDEPDYVYVDHKVMNLGDNDSTTRENPRDLSHSLSLSRSQSQSRRSLPSSLSRSISRSRQDSSKVRPTGAPLEIGGEDDDFDPDALLRQNLQASAQPEDVAIAGVSPTTAFGEAIRISMEKSKLRKDGATPPVSPGGRNSPRTPRKLALERKDVSSPSTPRTKQTVVGDLTSGDIEEDENTEGLRRPSVRPSHGFNKRKLGKGRLARALAETAEGVDEPSAESEISSPTVPQEPNSSDIEDDPLLLRCSEPTADVDMTAYTPLGDDVDVRPRAGLSDPEFNDDVDLVRGHRVRLMADDAEDSGQSTPLSHKGDTVVFPSVQSFFARPCPYFAFVSFHNIHAFDKAQVPWRWTMKAHHYHQVDGSSLSSREVLRGISGYMMPGQMTLIMGPCGSGKSTLMNILAAGCTQPHASENDGWDGRVLVNGVTCHKSFHRFVAWVPGSQDWLYPYCTVKEALLFSATLRNTDAEDPAQLRRFIETVLIQVGLHRVEDRVIGYESIGGLNSVLRRKVAVGVELAMNPSVLFLDDVTRGFDFIAEQSLMETLASIAANGTTVTISMNHPTSQVFAFFDRVILLSYGRIVYQGAPDGMLPFLKRFAGEASWNTLETMLSDFSLSERCADQFVNTPEMKAIESLLEKPPATHLDLPDDTRYVKSFGVMFLMVFKRLVGSHRYRLREDVTRLVMHVMQCLVIGNLLWDLGFDEAGMSGRNGFFIGSLIGLGFAGMSNIPNLMEERNSMNREVKSYYRPMAYFFARWIAEVPFLVLQSLAFSWITYPMIGLGYSGSKAKYNLGIFVTYNIAYLAMFVVAMLSPNGTVAVLVFSTIVVLAVLFGGAVVAFRDIPEGLRFLYYGSFMTFPHCYLATNEYYGLEFECESVVTVPLQPDNPDCDGRENDPCCYKIIDCVDPSTGERIMTSGEDYLERNFGISESNEYYGNRMAIYFGAVTFLAILATRFRYVRLNTTEIFT
eukprot:Rmarinus@m.11344